MNLGVRIAHFCLNYFINFVPLKEFFYSFNVANNRLISERSDEACLNAFALLGRLILFSGNEDHLMAVKWVKSF